MYPRILWINVACPIQKVDTTEWASSVLDVKQVNASFKHLNKFNADKYSSKKILNIKLYCCLKMEHRLALNKYKIIDHMTVQQSWVSIQILKIVNTVKYNQQKLVKPGATLQTLLWLRHWVIHLIPTYFTDPGVAGAVLQPPSFINLVILFKLVIL